MMKLNPQFSLLHRQLQTSTVRHSVISNNLANVNTPGFKAQEVVGFSETLDQVGRSVAEPMVADKPSDNMRLDGNNVDIHTEMGDLRKNAMMHRVYSQVLGSKIRQMQRAISDR